jgi:3-oxoacyl-[acyl-carrier protein] reductase
VNLAGKAALVTGGGTGIGRAIALEFARQGAAVCIAGRRREPLERVRQEVAELGGTALVHTADVAREEEATGLVTAAAEGLGRLDILVNNAGRTFDGLLFRLKWEALDESLAINLKSMFYLSAAAGKLMLSQKGGSIVNVTSVVALTGNAGQSAYVAAKAGVIGLTKSLAQELGSRQIRVNAVAPGFIETGMTATLPDSVKRSYAARIPLRRFGSPEDVAKVAAFLASDAAGYITGHVIPVDGGLAM